MQDILYDAQTSGGLLISLSAEKAELLLNKLKQAGVEDATLVGDVVGDSKGMVTVK